MKYINCRMNQFYQHIGLKRIICFGASSLLKKYYKEYGDWFGQWKDQILFFIDNDEKKWYTQYSLGENTYPIYSISKLENIDENDIILLITTSPKYVEAICDCVERKGYLKSSLCFSLGLLLNTDQIDDSLVEVNLNADIPQINSKIIHSFWFSGDEIPQSYQRCLDSWKLCCPDYEIKIWNADNYDVTKNKFMYEAYQRKNWAFVSDYARLDVIYMYGGIYMDMDVEVLRKLDDLLKFECFFGTDSEKYVDLGSGFGALKGNILIKRLMEKYDNLTFCLDDGTLNRIPQPRLLLDKFLDWGYQLKRDSQLIDGVAFLSTNYFYINEGKKLQNHFSGKEYLIHWHNAGWWSEEERAQRYKNSQEPLAKIEKKFVFQD